MYSDESYRLAKAATEEGIELMGNVILLIGAIEFLIYYLAMKKIKNEKFEIKND
jgi:hypothetical protein